MKATSGSGLHWLRNLPEDGPAYFGSTFDTLLEEVEISFEDNPEYDAAQRGEKIDEDLQDTMDDIGEFFKQLKDEGENFRRDVRTGAFFSKGANIVASTVTAGINIASSDKQIEDEEADHSSEGEHEHGRDDSVKEDSRLIYCTNLGIKYTTETHPRLIPNKDWAFDPAQCPKSLLELTLANPKVSFGPEHLRQIQQIRGYFLPYRYTDQEASTHSTHTVA